MRLRILCPDLSARWAYRAARNVDGTAGDDGTYLRSGVKGATKVGVAREVDFPFDPAVIDAPLTLGAAHDGFDLRGPRAYYRITTGPDGVRRALADGYPVIAGWEVDDAFMNWDGLRPIPARTGRIIGGHALCVVAYEDDGTFTFRNSWSPAWGRAGKGWASEAWVAQATDVWAIDLEAA